MIIKFGVTPILLSSILSYPLVLKFQYGCPESVGKSVMTERSILPRYATLPSPDPCTAPDVIEKRRLLLSVTDMHYISP